ncbi:inhibin alpha chain [Lepisosteus oculatus]|nr:PREDICTED: inhibin alpha chain [Lepisosteus oculatus]
MLNRCRMWFLIPLICLALSVSVCAEVCTREDLPKNIILDWFKQRVLDALGLKEPPITSASHSASERGDLAQHPVSARVGRAAWTERRRIHQETSQIILFPSTDSTCAHSLDLPSPKRTGHFTYYFQPSTNTLESVVTSAHFWFFSGQVDEAGNSSAPLFILTTHQQLAQVAENPLKTSDDGWVTYHIAKQFHPLLAEGPFVLQVRCPTCGCHSESDKIPFLHLHTHFRGPDRSRRSSLPWSPLAIHLLQRPSQEKPNYNDCHRAELNISFEELGWDNWIVHPKVFTFYYCHGNCSSWDRMTTILGMKQCCAPVPGTMRSLRFRTTSDSGYSFKYETLPNIIAEDCTCI